MRKLKYLVLLLAIFMLAACGTKTETVSEGVEKVVDAMFTAPNEKLCGEDAFAVIGEGVEEAVDSPEASTDFDANWQEAVGECFAEGALEKFLRNGPASMYLAEALVDNVEMSVKSVSLEEKGETFEKVNVVYTKDETEEDAVILFCVDAEGLITEVEVLFEK